VSSANGHGSASRSRTVGLVALVCSVVGYALEWFRQRGTCEFGDKSPDTLGVSLGLILVGGGVVGLIALGLAIAGAVRHGASSTWPAIVVAVAAVASAGLLFTFAAGGPGSWFQYCGT
jgi:hypothetical protein